MKRVKKGDVILQLAKGITRCEAHSDKEHPQHRLAVELAYILWNLKQSYKSGHYLLTDGDVNDLLRSFN